MSDQTKRTEGGESEWQRLLRQIPTMKREDALELLTRMREQLARMAKEEGLTSAEFEKVLKPFKDAAPPAEAE